MFALDILLVEDEAPKQKHIENFVQEIAPEASIRVARSFNSALDALEERVPMLMLLDMSLPTFDIGTQEPGGRPQGFGGTELMRYMAMSEISCNVIVITGYEAFTREAGKTVDLRQLKQELTEEFPRMLMGVLHYNSTYEEWKTELGRCMAGLNKQDSE